jgi:cellobiose-specific phosphotransferase system component IIB
MLGLDYSFDAVSYMSIYEEAQNYDVILIAPQIGYMLKRLTESLTDKLVLQIPTAIFASYDAPSALQFVIEELKTFNEQSKEIINESCCCCIKEECRVLAIAMLPNRAQTRIYYRLYDNGQIIDSHLIIKPSTNFTDFDDIMDTILVKYQYIDKIGIAVPGIVEDNGQLDYVDEKLSMNLKQHLQDKYNIDTYTYNNANCAAVGYSLEHTEYKNILFYSQPFGYGVGGQGIMIDGKLVVGKNGIAGESKFFIHRMQLSDDIYKLQWSEQGVLEIVTKAILPTISLLGPEVVAIRSPMTPDMNEIKKKLSSFIPEQFMPEFVYIKEASSYMLDGVMKLCIDNH